jgi:hypothetical protein
VHMTHDMEHQAINAALPDHVRLAFDGQIVEIEGDDYVVM